MSTPLRAGANSPISPNRYHPPSPPHHHHSSSHDRLLSASTFTYIASWRGQLLICTVVLVVGAVYFVIREPIERWRIRRKERLSTRAREALLKSEEDDALAASSSGEKSDTADGENLVIGGQRRDSADKEKDRGRKKDGAGKRRKSSVLKAAGLSVTPVGEPLGASSIESSPAPPASRAAGGRDRKASVGVRSPARTVEATTSLKNQDRSKSAATEQRDSKVPATSEGTPSRPSIRLSVPEEDAGSAPTGPNLLDAEIAPHLVALPPSPLSQSSNLPETIHDVPATSQGEQNGHAEAVEQPATRRKSDGFSIIPEEGYLPPPTPAVAGKKKKRKSKAHAEIKPEGSPKPSDGRRHSSASTSSGQAGSPKPGKMSSPSLSNSDGSLRSLPLSNISLLDVAASAVEAGSEKGQRSGAGGLTGGSALEEALREKERVIDALRAEIGVAKAEEGKARAEAERLRGELEQERERQSSQSRGRERTESMASRREHELHQRIKILESSYTTALHHIMSLESGMGTPLSQQMPASPFFPQGPQRMGSLSGPGTPYSPMGYPSPVPARSPMNVGMPMHSPGMPMPMGRGIGMGMPSPGIMYPSPGGMLHPGFVAASSPSPLRRTSVGGNLGPGGMTINATYDEHSNLAGPLSPGVRPGTPLNGASGSRGQTYPPPGSAAAAAAAGMYPAELGYGHVPSPMTGGMVDEPEQLDPEARAARRISIESSVLKKRPSHPGRDDSPEVSTTGLVDAVRASSEPIEEEPEGTAYAAADGQSTATDEVAGLGIGPIESVPASFTGPTVTEETDHHSDDAGRSSSGSLSSHPTSPSRRLLTPSHADLYPSSTQVETNCGDREEKATGLAAADSEAALEIPMFASLAHTEEQKREMARIREEALKRQRLRGSSLSVHSKLEAAAGIESMSCA